MGEHKALKITLIAIGVLIVLLTAFFIIKKPGSPKSITLNFWGYLDNEANLKKLIERYQDKHKNVTINYRQIEDTPEEYEKTITDAIASGNAPDIVQVRNDWIPKDYKKLAEVPESTYSLENFKKDYYDILREDLTYKDKLYAIPFSVDTLAMFYNPSILDATKAPLPTDLWTDLTKTSQKAKALDGTNVVRAGVALGGGINIEHSSDILSLLMLQNNTKMISTDQAKAYFNLSVKNKDGTIWYPGTGALDFYTSFANPTKENYTWRTDMPNSLDAFAAGKTAVYFGYASDIKKIKKATNEKLSFEVKKAPQFLGAEVYYAQYWAYAVPKNAKEAKTAWDFLKFASDKKELSNYTSASGLPSARKDMSEGEMNRKYMNVFIKQAEKAQSWFKGDWEKMDNIFIELVNDVVINKQPTQAAIDSAAKKATDALEEFKRNDEE